MPDLPISLILKSLPEEMVQEAVKIAVERMKLTPDKLATILIRHFNKDEIIAAGHEAPLRNVRPETLKKYKDAGDLPQLVNGK